jgi:sugar lactone lactonase YvrE
MPKRFGRRLTAFLFFVFFSCFAFSAVAQKPAANDKKIATEVSISLVDGIAVDPEGNIYISRRDHNAIDKIDKDGMLSRFAGSGEAGFAGDGGPALSAKLKIPAGLAVDKDGNLYIADRENHRVRKVNAKGVISTVAGAGTAGFSGDGGPAIQAALNLPSGVAVDDQGNLYIADRSNDRIRMVDHKGVIRTFAGTGVEGFSGDNGPAIKAQLGKPFGIALDKKGNLYIADRANNRVRKVAANGIITTVAGDGGFFFMGDNGPAYKASIAGPTGVATDDAGNIYIADRNNSRIRSVDKQGLIRTVMGTGQQDYNGDAEVARETNLHLPFGVAVDKSGNLLVIDRSNYRIRRVTLQNGQVQTIAGSGLKKSFGDGGPALGATLSFPHGIVTDSKDNVIFSDKGNYLIRRITPDGTIDTLAGNGTRGTSGDGGPGNKATLYNPTSLVINQQNEIYLINPSGFISLIRKIDPQGVIDQFITTADTKYIEAIKAHKQRGVSSKSELAVITQFSDIALDSQGDLYTPDRINHQIRKIDAKTKAVTTIGGTGDSDFYGDGGPATKAAFRDPQAIAIDKEGNVFIADAANNRIRKIDAKGIVTTLAGNGLFEDSGDGGPALQAGIRSMDDLQISPAGELYIVGANTNVIRKVTAKGMIETVAGKAGFQGYTGDGGPAAQALLKSPTGIAFDSKNNLYICDLGNNAIRKVDAKGVISTLAGSGAFGWGHEGEKVEIYFQNFP